MQEITKVALDAMGGDNAPQAIVQGALDAKKLHDVDIILVGRVEEILKAVLRFLALNTKEHHSFCLTRYMLIRILALQVNT